jgi:anti-sigma-K factor RskA
MVDAQRIAQDRIPFMWRLALAALAAAAVAALVDWLFYGGF